MCASRCSFLPRANGECFDFDLVYTSLGFAWEINAWVGTELEILAPACIIRQGCLQPRDPRSAFCTKSVLFSRERDSSGGPAACRAPRAEAVLPLFPSGTRTRMLNGKRSPQADSRTGLVCVAKRRGLVALAGSSCLAGGQTLFGFRCCWIFVPDV